MTNYATGHLAEKYACDYLSKNGYKVVATNWHTRYCEIDIIARRKKIIYFIEVKYRHNTMQGAGLDYVTPTKLRQMRFAAEMWVSENGWAHDYNLGAIELSGSDFEVSQFLPVLE